MPRRFKTKMCLTLVATGTALAGGSAPAALASSQTLTEVQHKVFLVQGQLSEDPWTSGRVTTTATRMPDGRIRVKLSARVVLTRTITAELAIQPCNASYNAVDLAENAADPAGHPLVPVVTYSGYSPFKYLKLHKGLNDNLQLTGVVSSDDQWTVVPHHWTDCVAVNFYDARETDKKAIAENQYIPERKGDDAFHVKPLILSVTPLDNLSQHL